MGQADGFGGVLIEQMMQAQGDELQQGHAAFIGCICILTGEAYGDGLSPGAMNRYDNAFGHTGTAAVMKQLSLCDGQVLFKG